VAPDGAQQSDLVLKGIHEVLSDPAKLKDLEKNGITRSQIEQLGKKYEKMKSAPPGPGREIKVKPGEQTATQPAADLPELDKSLKFSTKTQTDRGSMPQDQIANNNEDLRFRPPSDLKSKLIDYNNSLSNKFPGGKRPTAVKPKNGK
jgi:hypothetical protein